jgi:transcriptional antiterminator NusG
LGNNDMDIHDNEEQLGITESPSEEMQTEEETSQDAESLAETEEIVEESTEAEQISDDEEEEELTPVGEMDVSEEIEELEPDSEAEETEDTDLVDEILPIEEEVELADDSESEETEETDPIGEILPGEEEVELDDDSEPEEILDEETTPDPYASVLASGVPEKEPEDGRAWYVVHCYSGNEDKVRHNIMQRIESMSMDEFIFDVVVPTEDEVNIKNGERQTVEKKVFPGYILVNMILTEESWYMVRNTPGVTGFVGMGNDPTPLQPEEVARILKRMESESPRINVTFRAGERVRIVDGPFEDFYGKVAEIDMERATVRVMVNFFGRETPVELDFLQVEQA